MKKEILIVGFGLMGCRHVQAILQSEEKYIIHVLEPSEENIASNCTRIGAKKSDCKWYMTIEDVPFVDLAIVATSSEPRFNIVKTLLEKGIKLFLLEKIVFQSKLQFDEIINLMDKKNARAWCNFANRYFNSYNKIKDKLALTNENINVSVYGGELGLGCNAIHYIDLFQYITNVKDLNFIDYRISELKIENKRGKQYKEFIGSLLIKNSKGHQMSIISEKGFSGGITISIQQGLTSYVLSENTQHIYTINNKISDDDFIIIPTSKLTEIIVKDIFDDNCRLTKVDDTYEAHINLFSIFNETIFKNHTGTTLCPIT